MSKEALTLDPSPDGRGKEENPIPDPSPLPQGREEENPIPDPSPLPQGREKEAGWRDELVIDISGITYRDMRDIYRTGTDGQRQIFQRIVKQMPTEWGSFAEGTFKRRYWKAIDTEMARLFKLEKPLSVDVTFDVWDLTMDEHEALVAGKADVQIVAKYVTRAPKSWGPMHEIDTWLNLPHPVWMAVADALIEALNEVNLN